MSTTYQEPIWTIPLPAVPDCSAFKVVGPSPFRLTGAFVRLLQYHFSTPDNIENPLLKGYVWTPSRNGCSAEETVDEDGNPITIPGSRILITTGYRRESLNVQQRPALYVQRGPVETKAPNAAFQNRSVPAMSTANGIFEGTQHHYVISGSHNVIAVGLEGAEADALAEEAYFRLMQYTPVIRDDLNLGYLFVDTMSDVKEIAEEAKKAFYVSLRISWSYTFKWRIVQESPVLKRVVFQYSTD